ncbi:unnamed protein product [Mytilus edulis]|uniref:Uncharacterized protein n=1 Tax=Mytilus edulis TaxID=6550 RepID=A0A8S3Q1G7_MYTED|nr:unnamed protein product [Mytilus edulis]
MSNRRTGVTYYEWKSDIFHCGHAAICLSDGTYISYWHKSPYSKLLLAVGMTPLKSNIFILFFDYIISWFLPFTDNKTFTKTYTLDAKIMGREADRRITFHSDFLKEDEIKEWWYENRMLSYGLFGRNCATIVFRALQKGGATKYQCDPEYSIWTLKRMYDYCEKLQRKTYRLQNGSMHKYSTDFEYILKGLKHDAKIAQKTKEEVDKRKENIKKSKKETSSDEKSEETKSSDEENSEDEKGDTNKLQMVPVKDDNQTEQEHTSGESRKQKTHKKKKDRWK